MSLLPPGLAEILRCPSCGGGRWLERPSSDAPRWGLLECASCEREYLVADGIPVLLRPHSMRSAPSPPPSRDGLVGDARTLLEEAFGRCTQLLGGVEQVVAQAEREPIERAFDVPGESWVSMARFGFPSFDRVRTLFPDLDTLLDLGCGYGCSAAPFLSSGQARAAIGIDENLFYLLLFRRYARQRGFERVWLLCFDLERLPYPLADGVADGVLGASFFNHFVCLKKRRFVTRFFDETARLLKPGGKLVLNMVPNRRNPFPHEVNLREVISEPRLRSAATRTIRALPLAWLPSFVTVPALWSPYVCHSVARRERPLGYRAFSRALSKAVPEASLRALPFRPSAYPRLMRRFGAVEIAEHRRFHRSGEFVPLEAESTRASYLVVRCTR